MPNSRSATRSGRDSRRYDTPSHVRRDYGIGRDKLFKMIKDGVIRTISFRKPDARNNRSIRLIDLRSLEEYLAQFATGPETDK